MIEYPIEPGQRMIIKPNNFSKYSDLAHSIVCLGKVESTEDGIIARDCIYRDNDFKLHYLDIPLLLLWRIADDEDLIGMHESYIQSMRLTHINS